MYGSRKGGCNTSTWPAGVVSPARSAPLEVRGQSVSERPAKGFYPCGRLLWSLWRCWLFGGNIPPHLPAGWGFPVPLEVDIFDPLFAADTATNSGLRHQLLRWVVLDAKLE